MKRPVRIGALISGGGRTLLNILDEIEAGRLAAEIPVVIASRASIAGVERARKRGLNVCVLTRANTGSDEALHDALTACLREHEVDLVCACGYLRHLRVDSEFAGRILNIHPALLPDFGGRGMYGDHVHAAVLESGRGYSGCTVHWVDDLYDHGPIIAQRCCPVLPGDTVATLAARVFALECSLYPEVIRQFAAGRLSPAGTRGATTNR